MRVGIDVGGTFTDLVAATSEGIRVAKVPSTPADPASGFLTALERIDGVPEEIRHGTTVATNAVLTRSGSRLAFVTTHGFRHLLHLARQTRPSLYDLRARPPSPLVDRDRCIGAVERTGPDGEVTAPLDTDALRAALAELDGDVEAVAVTLLHAYANPVHERAVAEVVREVLPDVAVSLSSDVLPEFREYERASTTALNAYVQSVMSRYLGRIADAVPAGVGVMWSSGGVRSIAHTSERAVQTLLSGPAAGVLAAAWVGERCGIADLITLDMGGTSADVAIVDDGRPLAAEEASLDGLPFRTPCLDVISVGAGGGSIAWVDEGGALRVGPRSAGADPGPASYGRGGSDPTVTDAHVVAGHLASDGLAGGDLPLDVDAAQQAIGALAQTMGVETSAAADGVLRVVRATMARAIRSVSIERGKDVRRYALVAFGGAGPLHAVALARDLGIPKVVIPPAPGALAALGLLVASRRADASVSRPMPADERRDGELRSILHELTEDALAQLADEGVEYPQTRISLAVDCRYVGQSHELRLAIDGRPSFRRLIEEFHQAHRERYGFARPQAGVEAVTFRAAATGPAGDVDIAPPSNAGDPAPVAQRDVGPVYDRASLAVGARISGPALITEVDSTTWLPDGAWAEVHASGALIVEV